MTRLILILSLSILACALQSSPIHTMPPKREQEQAIFTVFDYHNQDRAHVHHLQAEDIQKRAEGLR